MLYRYFASTGYLIKYEKLEGGDENIVKCNPATDIEVFEN